jgi:hypothetical protein
MFGSLPIVYVHNVPVSKSYAMYVTDGLKIFGLLTLANDHCSGLQFCRFNPEEYPVYKWLSGLRLVIDVYRERSSSPTRNHPVVISPPFCTVQHPNSIFCQFFVYLTTLFSCIVCTVCAENVKH